MADLTNTAPKRNAAVERIRAIVAEHGEAIGVDAIEFTPGAVVLLVARFAPSIDMMLLDELHRSLDALAKGLRAEGVRACGVALPDGISLQAFEMPDAP